MAFSVLSLLLLGTAIFLVFWFYLLPRGAKSPSLQAMLSRTSRSRESLLFFSNLLIATIMALIAIIALGWGESMNSTIAALAILAWLLIGFIVGSIIIIIYESARSIREDRLAKKKAKRDEEIKPIAYRIWEQEGRPSGRDKEHWDKAEAIWNELNREESKGILYKIFRVIESFRRRKTNE
jgi:hypothetical protein